jgi:hypothetical protein
VPQPSIRQALILAFLQSRLIAKIMIKRKLQKRLQAGPVANARP